MAYWKEKEKKSSTSSGLKTVRLSSKLLIFTSLPLLFLRKRSENEIYCGKLTGIPTSRATLVLASQFFVRVSIRTALW